MSKSLILKVLLIVTIALSGCAVDPDSFSPDGFSPDELTAIQSAGDEWCAATGCCPHLGDGASEIHGVAQLAGNLADADGCAWGRADGVTAIWIRVGAKHPLSDIRSTALHEFGHHCGCSDTYYRGEDGNFVHPPTVMGVGSEHLTPEDIACAVGRR